jgi:hypothetical protein
LISVIDKIHAPRDSSWRVWRPESLYFEAPARIRRKAHINEGANSQRIDAPSSCQNCNSDYHTELIRGTNIAFYWLAGKLGSAA